MSFNIVAESNTFTVVSEYTPVVHRRKSYQSEAELEEELIHNLGEQGIPYLPIHTSDDLTNNLRLQIEKLNEYLFTDNEWKQFYLDYFANPAKGIKEKTNLIQKDNVQTLHCDDGSVRNIRIIDRKHPQSNYVQVINQYEADNGTYKNRYDVTLLVNGLPLVHVELKRRGVPIREAYNQINRYKKDSFWSDDGLYQFVQIFVISNGIDTKYYSNTTRHNHMKALERNIPIHSSSNSFEFTSYWSDGKNKTIHDLVDFTRTFFCKQTLLNVLCRYCVFTTDETLMVMRPYQIAACERILNRIRISSNYKKYGTLQAGGYIWHTTGSGKTLTSFKTAQLACELDGIDKVIFVVDRKDLDYQTMKEYDKFEKGAANGNTSTKILQRQLENPQAHIIITTIQKLSTFISRNTRHSVYQKHVVLIFDECHRSQFGNMHTAITKSFKKYHIFGFTGTPIFAKNAGNTNPNLKTTSQAFGDCLHTYTIVDAINDGNVLPFRIDYVDTMKIKQKEEDTKVAGIDTKTAIMAPQRISAVTEYIIDHFNQKTRRNAYSSYTGSTRKKKDKQTGFNSIFAVDSIPLLKLYYEELQKQLKEKDNPLFVAAIYSFSPNEELSDGILEDEDLSTSALDSSSRDFLSHIISDYNEHFHTRFDTSQDGFQNYYKDISMRMKNGEIDILLVVNMFLTGFDAPCLNTLWVDKNLRYHGLLQAFSRTNRILDSVKSYGNIICFRNLEKETDEALSLFGNKDVRSVVLLRSYDDYYNGYTDANKIEHKGYKDMVKELVDKFPLNKDILGEKKEKEFIGLFGNILRIRNILSSFDSFDDTELTPLSFQNYQGRYLDIYNERRRKQDGIKEDIRDDIEFEIELVKQVEINIDYILYLIAKYRDENMEDKQMMETINHSIDSSMQLRSKKQLIFDFISKITHTKSDKTMDEEWDTYVNERKTDELEEIIKEEKLKPEKTERYMDESLKDGHLKTIGTGFDGLLPNVSRFGGKRRKIKERVAVRLENFFERFLDVV